MRVELNELREELDQCIDTPDVSLIQLPLNLLDHRWDPMEDRIRAARERGVLIHVRSIFLQGLLLTNDPVKWSRAGADAREMLGWLQDVQVEAGADSIAELCVRYVCGMDWVDGVVVGLETMAQLKTNIRLFSLNGLESDVLERVARTRPLLIDRTLNPVNWLD